MVRDSSYAISEMPTAAPRWSAWAEVALIFLVFFVQGAGPAPETNEAHYLGKTKHYWNPAWIERDYFLNSPDAHETFYWSLGWLTRFYSLSAVAWIGRLVGWGFLAWAWRRASFAVVPRPLFAVLSAALFVTFVARYHLAGEWIVGGVEAKVFAYALVLLGVEALVRNAWRRVWLLFGAAAAFHVLVGGWAIVAAGFAWLLSDRTTRPTLLSMAPALVGGFLLSLPGLYPALMLTSGVDPHKVSEANQIYVFRRLPHHLALHTLDPLELFQRLIRNGPLLLAFALLAWVVPADDGVRRLRGFVIGSMLLVVIGFAIGFGAGENLELGGKLLRYYWFRLYDFALPLGAALLAVLAIASWQATRPRWAFCGLFAAVALCTWHLGGTVLARQAFPYPAADRKMASPADWQAACQWIKQNTPREALFLTPRNASTFKWFAERAEVVTQKDVPQDALGIVEWWDRMDRVHRYKTGETRQYRKTLAHQGERMLVNLAKKYEAHYLLTETTKPLEFPVLYRNDHYVVYAVPESWGATKGK